MYMLFSKEPLRLQSHCASPVPNRKFDLSSLNTFYVDFFRAPRRWLFGFPPFCFSSCSGSKHPPLCHSSEVFFCSCHTWLFLAAHHTLAPEQGWKGTRAWSPSGTGAEALQPAAGARRKGRQH